MKNITYITFLIITLFSCDNQNKNSDQTSSQYTQTANLKKQGLIKSYYDVDQKKIKAEVNYSSKGVKDGWAKTYYDNGQLWKSIFYINGKKDGIVKEFYKNGTLYKEVLYENDILTERKFFYSDGKVKAIIPYMGGKLTFGTEEYSKSGKKLSKYPKVFVKKTYPSSSHDEVVLKLTLSEKRKNLKFYVCYQKEDVQCLDFKKHQLIKAEMKDREGRVLLKLPKGANIQHNVQVIAEYVTYSGNKKLEKINYNLNVSST
ncbi:hypothetical protein [Flammeovirga sp. SubArs3]|uniref:toxin-antitoxin system YwqK family antitoxin n=1 Tax=Flammeovirga sp. SubArs3 TaxID=2995316 RepID=UPI00248B8061|nr:hypothetical protein [Flammeovirga sp. SubArs3]